MSQLTSIALNIKQNSAEFELDPLDLQPPLFKFKYLLKTLDKAKPNPEKLEDYRTVTVRCLVRGCNKKWLNQKVNQTTSNYFTHFRTSHKSINIEAIKNNIDPRTITSNSTRNTSQLSLKESFNNNNQQDDELEEEEKEASFMISHFKRLLLNFVVSNNISFRAVTSISFRKLMAYLHKEVPPLYSQVLTDELTLYFNNNKSLLKGLLLEQIKTQGGFSLTLDAWTAINQDAYLGITM
ncbi:hypothetical protein BKA61DRAFT_655233 [Leptodontidium sp. MPI-SDFR-AT-0119]|nr:hypothetical protein BKA61DRAFT_655233 [Leptodontidium sp. MPI-SDFR-AT-0119]